MIKRLESPALPRRHWLQFSLRTALVLILVAAVGVSTWNSNERAKENERLLAENERLHVRLRNELGELEIKDADRDKLHAIAIPTIEPMTWKWRIYVPPGRQFSIDSDINNVSDDNLPEHGSRCSISAGEQLLVIALRKNDVTGNWEWIEQCGGTSCGPVLPPHRSKWINNSPIVVARYAGLKQTAIVQPGQPLEILRYRRFPQQTGPGPHSYNGPADGILVWLSEEKPKQ